MKTISITEKQSKKFRLPAKAIGDWAIVEETDDYKLLHKLKKDGSLGSDRANNIIKLFNEVFDAMNPSTEKAIIAKSNNGETVVIAKTRNVDICEDDEPKIESKPEANIKMNDDVLDSKTKNISTRKARWIEQLVSAMKSEPFTLQFIEKLGELKFVDIVLEDTSPDRIGGKAYSSIDSAMNIWNSRIRRGIEYGNK